MYYVDIIKGIDQHTIKCVVSQLTESDIKFVHKEVYSVEVTLNRRKIYDKEIFCKYLEKISKLSTRFVSVNFGTSTTHHSELSFGMYNHQQEADIEKLITYVNNLSGLVSDYVYGTQFFYQTLLIQNSTETMIIEVEEKCVKTRYILCNKNYIYSEIICDLFPEFELKIFKIPKLKLAEDMFFHQIKQESCLTVINKINIYFNTINSLEHGQNYWTPYSETDIFSGDIPSPTDSNNIDTIRNEIIKNFYRKKCQTKGGELIQSAVLYQHFQQYYYKEELPERDIPFESLFNPINMTCFSLIFQRITGIEKIKKAKAMYWIDLYVVP
jgi:hypothetical protein